MFKILNWLLFGIVPTFSIFGGMAVMEEQKGIAGALAEQEKGYAESTAQLEERQALAEEDVAATEAKGLAQYQPYQEAGTQGLSNYQDLVSGGVDYAEIDNPAYQWRLQQGMQARERTASRSGDRFSGRFAMGMEQYAQGMASQEYENIYNRRSQGYGNLMNIGLQASGMANQWRGSMYDSRRGLDQYFGGQLNQNIMGRAGARAGAEYGKNMATSRLYAGVHKDMAAMGMSAAGSQSQPTDIQGGGSKGGGGGSGGDQGGGGFGGGSSGSYDTGGNWSGGSSSYNTSGMFNNMSWQGG